MTVILFNNHIYGMTGGQYSPTTPQGRFASTAPYGNLEAPFNTSGLAEAAGASFVACTTAYHIAQMERFMKQGIQKKGFSLIEVRTPCPVAYGRRNRLGSPVDMFKALKEGSLTKAQAEKMKPEELEGKIITGVLVDVDKPEYIEEYDKLIEKVGKAVSG